jgi:putative flippase GtrA
MINNKYDSFAYQLERHRTKVKFILVGIWNTIFGYGVFYFLDNLFTDLLLKRQVAYMFAIVLSNIIAIVNAYIFHKLITFQSKVKSFFAITFEFSRFSLTYLFSFILSVFLLPLSVEIIGINPKIAAAFIILICAVISYYGHSKFSFQRAEPYDLSK